VGAAGGSRVALFEQPCNRDDYDGLRRVRESGVRVAADESARSPQDIIALAQSRAVDCVNIKLMKSGIVDALTMIETARAAGLALMIGGMVESRLAMSVSACLAAGLGGFSYVDLDTPLFMRNEPFEGGFAAIGAERRVDGIRVGHGVEWLGSLASASASKAAES
jgi:L-alanine-DL-glutamate epimerase-like enolase superfamily enzyme